MKNQRTIIIIGVIVIIAILALFIPAFKQKKDLTTAPKEKEEVVYEGNTEDTGNNRETNEQEEKQK